MKKFYGFYTLLFAMMSLIIMTSANAFFTGYGKGINGDKAFTTLNDREAVPEGFGKSAWQKIRASIEQDRYQLHKDDRKGGYQAPNFAHDLHTTFTREGFEVSPRKGEKAWTWGLRFSRYGYGSDLNTVTGAEKIITKNNRIEYHRGNMVEWYVNDHRGIEQGFTLKARPSGWMESGPLQLQMKTTGNLIPGMKKQGKGIIFLDARGNEVLRYSGLYAYDASGKKLEARMATDQEGIRVIVEDHEAVYPITIDPFIETIKLLAGDGAADDEFGYSVSISGDMAIIGAYGDDDNGISSGSAYIFSRNQGGTNNWAQVQKLVAGDGAAGDYFGYSVSISTDTAIVGAYGDDDNGNASGSAYIFSRDQGGTDNWGQVQKLTAGDGWPADFFGHSVSISGDTAIVGAYADDDNGDGSGSAYIFSRDQGGTDNWGQVQKLTASDGAASDYFGFSVSISADTAIVGASRDDDNGSLSGSAYIFSRDQGGTDNWGQVQKLVASDGAASDYFGFSVSIRGNTAIIGAYGDDDNGNSSGSAYIFYRDQGGTDNWGQVQKLVAGDGAVTDFFGYSVSISGNTAIVGAYRDDDNGSDSGSAYIFCRDQGGSDNWGEVKKLTPGDGAVDDQFGFRVSISGNAAIVGARFDDDNGSDSGSAYIFFPLEVTDELAVDFGINGLWHYDGTTWTKKTSWNPDDDLAGRVTWTNGLAVDFGSNGLWNYDGMVWKKKTSWNTGPGGMTGWTGGLAVDFDDNGLWNYDGTTWIKKTSWNPDNDLAGWSGGLAVDFGTNGLWNYDGTIWSKKTNWNPGSGGLCGWSGGLAIDFDGNGLWNYDGSTWSKKTSWNPGSGGLCGWSGGLAVDFDANGLWNYDGSTWTKKTSWDPEGICALGNGLAVDFGPNGLWCYDGATWSKKTSWDAENLTDVDLY